MITTSASASHTAALRPHDSDHRIGKATLSQLNLPGETLQASDIELAVFVNQLRRETLVPAHSRIGKRLKSVEQEIKRKAKESSEFQLSGADWRITCGTLAEACLGRKEGFALCRSLEVQKLGGDGEWLTVTVMAEWKLWVLEIYVSLGIGDRRRQQPPPLLCSVLPEETAIFFSLSNRLSLFNKNIYMKFIFSSFSYSH